MPVRIAIIKNAKIPDTGEDMGKEITYSFGGNVNQYIHHGKQFENSLQNVKLKHNIVQ